MKSEDEKKVDVGEKEAPKMDVVRLELSPDDLVPADYNANEMDEEEFALLKENIVEAGFVDPVTVIPLTDGKYGIIGGEHRWRAAKALDIKIIPVDLVQKEKWKDEDFQKFQNVRLNVIHGKMNPEKFLKLYNEMVEKYGKEKIAKLMGYKNDTAIRKIVKNVAQEMKASLPPEMARQFEEQAKEARTIGDLERIIQHLFQEHGDSLKFNFMVFAWGGKEHIYVAMSKKVHTAMKKIMAKSKSGSIDINEIIANAIEQAAADISSGGSNGVDDVARA